MVDQSVSIEEIEKHNSSGDCWIVVDNIVWDITDFAPTHPGGADIIHRHAGHDASTAYNTVHSPSLISKTLGPSKRKGVLDLKTIPENSDWLKPPPTEIASPELEIGAKPPLGSLINSHDFEAVAEKTLTKKAWAFYSSAATNCVTRNANKSMFDRIWFRPRLLRNIRDIDTRTKILGQDVELPFFVSPAAMARLAHPDGELALARGCEKYGLAQCISTNASYTMAEITGAAPSVPFFFQLYVNKDRSASETLIKDAERNGMKGIFVTIDGPVQGKREADERVKVESTGVTSAAISGVKAKNDSRGGGLGRTMGTYIDATFSWDDIAWLRRSTKLPIVVKGVQTAEDALLAMKYEIDGIFISNHGGRNLDTSPPSILTLLEIRRHCPKVFQHVEVYVDCGIRRGTDVVKALCLGARAVGMGRPFLYSLTYGQEGVEHFIDSKPTLLPSINSWLTSCVVMKDELETSLRLLGIKHLSQAHPRYLNTCDIDNLIPKHLDSPDDDFALPLTSPVLAKL
ncbi:FMN-dependent dehydrogenase-domain-containing protein [Lophiotrema nucula]|uniref:L-lactate dehydrogenase (cytochrome) n=1 Tax=Lophiotrema nucula TaxID=690887 RepID=A0A6A5YMK8_9PLEO|nr:FMN-dependent dehydrogenase-domain-containing protein [Lophiotrema nucula]